MKVIVTFAALFVAVAILPVSCTHSKPEKTIENLKAAISGETNASANYKAYSAKAAQEGLVNISKMFAAASAAEAIHIKNHNAVLTKLGQEVFSVTPEAPKVNTTAENTQAAISSLLS